MALYWATWGLTIVLVVVVGGLLIKTARLLMEIRRLEREVAEQRARLAGQMRDEAKRLQRAKWDMHETLGDRYASEYADRVSRPASLPPR